MIIPGIDAGNSRFKFAEPGVTGVPQLITNRFGEPFTPSAVFFQAEGPPIVGTEALNAGFAEPDRLVTNWKRSMGTDAVLHSSDDGTAYRAMDILAILLADAKDSIEIKTDQVVNEAVITVPANYTEAQKQQTIDAAAKAGIKAILLPHEPTAAALGNELHKRNNCTALVFDLGGGTFDVSIVRSTGNVCEIIATGGDPNVGGRDFNDRVGEKLLDEFENTNSFRPSKEKHPIFFQEMTQRIEQLKISLSIKTQSQIVLSCEGNQLNMSVSRDQFNSWVTDIAKKTIVTTEKVIAGANLDMSQIDEVYAVGGGSMMPIIKELLEEVTGKKVSRRCEPHVAAAMGAVLAGRIEYSRQGKSYKCGEVVLPAPVTILHDILSYSVGVMALDEQGNEVCSEILPEKTPVPSIQTRLFKLAQPDQTAVTIKILEGEDGKNADRCLSIGHFDLNGLPVRPDMIGRIEVTFSLDSNGLLTAKARDTASGKTAEMEIAYDYSGKNQDGSQAA
ncbi:Heat shock protein 70 [Limihaloglobus sulfuriphilus]|uniref:Heat shock protein 70 n=1 Tax=Limihaloglobus sulfuriphilus TaxID=1851148 RepID=A0A1Q2MDY6_9BACT|nr:Hsp70 family protein [Limihaloglobus sulfuriphilus]AQQ70916.1 Heat shock protein 70 [Limihaloglobus sulfuriphilus]